MSGVQDDALFLLENRNYITFERLNIDGNHHARYAIGHWPATGIIIRQLDIYNVNVVGVTYYDAPADFANEIIDTKIHHTGTQNPDCIGGGLGCHGIYMVSLRFSFENGGQ